VIGTLGLSVSSLHYALRLSPKRQTSSSPSDFDRIWGVNTEETINLFDLDDINSPNYLYGVRYQPTHSEIFRRIITAIDINHSDYIFIDCGSGKGRLILMASEFPFQRVLGVEFSPELNRIAEENIRAYKSATQKCKDLQSVCMDVATFPIPPAPAVFYLYNPFAKKVMKAFLSNIEKSLEKTLRDVYILYHNPILGKMWEHSSYFKKIRATPEFGVYQSVTLEG
jgi:predicted RNA methylase